ncbi:MAG: pilus assembly protein N-terminal domain-containing protein [Candidatus Solibacter sp.]
MSRLRIATTGILLAALWIWLAPASRAGDEVPPAQEAPQSEAPGKLVVTVGKSLIIDSPMKIQRISVADGALIEAVAVNPKEVLINGKAAGETSLIVWQEGGNRLLYDLTVRLSPARLDVVRQQLARDFPKEDINVTFENETAFVRGTVKDVIAADRVMAIAASLGKFVNLLRVEVPPVDEQILLKVRFCNVDRSSSSELGVSFASGAFNQGTVIGTGQFSGPSVNGDGTLSLSDALSVLLFRRDINLAASIKALESKRLLETLAEPNVLAINGKQASFVAGGEFPFPMVQPGANGNAISVQFREFGIRILFTPRVTPRGTIQLQVMPEVSALDYSNAVTVSGSTIPALSTRRVQTEVELDSGQSFVIAGLMDNRMTETISKIPGLASIPLLGKLFTSRSAARNNSELLVIVTPEIVRPIPASQPVPDLKYPFPFMTKNSDIDMRHPSLDKTGPVPVKAAVESMPVEELIQQRKEGQPAPQANPMMPMLIMPVGAPPAQSPTAAAPSTGGVAK